MSAVTLYGVPFSLYTGRPRSYFIKAGIPYREVPPSSEHYMSAVLPKAGSRFGIPVAELADGQVIRDGVAIVDFFESQSGFSFPPITPKQKIAADRAKYGLFMTESQCMHFCNDYHFQHG
jgi:hypothetical protein